MVQKGSSVIAILALIVGIGAIGMGGYNFYVQTIKTEDAIGNSWFKLNSTYVPTDPTSTYITFSGLTIQFNIISGQSAYFLYNGYVSLRLTGAGYTWIEVYFSLDGHRINSPNIEKSIYYDAEVVGASIRDDLSLQYSNSTLTPGIHEITIVIRGNSDLNAIRESTLFVQTYSS